MRRDEKREIGEEEANQPLVAKGSLGYKAVPPVKKLYSSARARIRKEETGSDGRDATLFVQVANKRRDDAPANQNTRSRIYHPLLQ